VLYYLKPLNPIINKKKELYSSKPRAREKQEYKFHSVQSIPHFSLTCVLLALFLSSSQPDWGKPHFIPNDVTSCSYSFASLSPTSLASPLFYSADASNSLAPLNQLKKSGGPLFGGRRDLPQAEGPVGKGYGSLNSLRLGSKETRGTDPAVLRSGGVTSEARGSSPLYVVGVLT
jgi:hypothetical protein